jgi:putative membrane protein
MDKNELAEERTEWAERRTKWADQRTYLAQQRTFAGWVRTGFTSIAVGFGTIEFLGKDRPLWLITSIGLIFISLGGLIPVLALYNYLKVEMNMKRANLPKSSMPSIWIIIITVGMVIAAAGGVLLVFMN